MPFELRSARSLDRSGRAELFTASYEGYVVPFGIEEAQLAYLEKAFDLDVDASRIAFRDGVPVGLANLGVRGEDGWVGGVGVVASARRRGVGRQLMEGLHEQARARGLRRVWLEVIDANTGAFALYEQLGYRVVRQLEVWSLPLAVGATAAAREVPFVQAHARIRELRTSREPWQRADETLAHHDDLRGLETDGGAAVLRPGPAAVQLLQVAGGDVEQLLRTIRVESPVSMLNLPPDDPAADAFRALGGAVAVRQHEMVLEL